MDVPDVPARTFEAPRDQNDQAQVASSTVVGFVRPDAVASEPDDVDASEQPDDVQASAEPEGATASAAPDDADDDAVDADAPAAVAPADVAQDSLGPRRDDAADEGAMRTETAPQSVTTPPKWVDWSWNAKGPVSVPGPTSRLGNGGDSGGPDEDDAGLRSATSQLRRAVTDIDWNDLPSASNG
jgi:hypothetical protein